MGKYKKCSVVVLGTPGVGKTSLITRMLFGVFGGKDPGLYPVNETYTRKYHNQSSEEIEMEFLIINKIPRYSEYKVCTPDVFLFVYDPDDWFSVMDLLEMMTLAKSCHPMLSKVPVIIVANKIDVRDNRDLHGNNVNETEQANELKSFCKSVHMQTSAKTGYNVSNLLRALINAYVKSAPVKTVEDGAPVLFRCSGHCTQT
ncbi:ras-related protein rapA-like [Saccoglossus kowalevskii]|uniref:Ras-related protein rapA-like n=1 Tax=Saccoglossus kowalevskii TaxID=10224 RepID=A0ABM0MHY3_SACKO|nr:PREDICTED: ras-related protein rapA-like [Saccoglossus kowalevskii]